MVKLGWTSPNPSQHLIGAIMLKMFFTLQKNSQQWHQYKISQLNKVNTPLAIKIIGVNKVTHPMTPACNFKHVSTLKYSAYIAITDIPQHVALLSTKKRFISTLQFCRHCTGLNKTDKDILATTNNSCILVSVMAVFRVRVSYFTSYKTWNSKLVHLII